MSTNGDKPFVDQLIEAAFTAPLGIASLVQWGLPDMVERSRQQVNQQVAMARFIGKLAVQQGQTQVRRKIEARTAPQPAPSDRQPVAPAPPTLTVVASDAPKSPVASESAHPTVLASDLALSDFDSLAAAQVVARLDGLSPSELDLVEHYEQTHRRRRTVLGRIAQLKDAG